MTDRSLSRRHAMKLAGGVVLGAGAVSLGAAAPAAASDVRGFDGTWDGSLDGRHARLVVNVFSLGPQYVVQLRLTDLDRDVSYAADVYNVPLEADRLENINLTGNSGTKEWLVLHRHTWSDNSLSGRTRWDGKEYGFSFWRQGTNRAYITPARPFKTWNDWLGGRLDQGYAPGLPPAMWYATYDGNHDGRNASLRVYAVPYAGNGAEMAVVFDFWDLERGAGWRQLWPYRGPAPFGTWSYDQQRTPILGNYYFAPLNGAAGSDLQINRMFWHSWNAWYVSGQSVWNGKSYGFSFIRQTPFATE
ncbi:hypothetical protein [Streptomyces sp. NRRL F-525]|uniref:hypothetical protein n=1 Tax=Streptomyces sp. NRRL F-525 TaxID=1463861 RepID=UPI000527CEAF|nr:hypothetical protein [Streptomyces sp. NRRL F-525]